MLDAGCGELDAEGDVPEEAVAWGSRLDRLKVWPPVRTLDLQLHTAGLVQPQHLESTHTNSNQ